MRKIYLLFFFFLLLNDLDAQLSKFHYFPPVPTGHYAGNSGEPHKDYIYVTTPSTSTVNVKIHYDGTFTTHTVSNTTPLTVQFLTGPGSYNSPMLLKLSDNTSDRALFGTALSNKGIWIEAEEEIYANYRLVGGGLSGAGINAQGEMLISKGTAARGTEFYSGHLVNTDVANDRGNFVSVMSLSDNNIVEISNLNANTYVVGKGTGISHTVVLDRYEVVVFAASPRDGSSTDADADGKAFIGAKITSSSDVVVNSGSANGNMGEGDNGRDYAIDQIVPLELVGTDYLLVEGNGVSRHERAIIVATEPNTTVKFNSNTTAVPIPTVGFLVTDHNNPNQTYDANGILTLQSDKPVYVYQATMGSSVVNTQAMFFIPPVSCSAPTFIDLISDIDLIGTTPYTGSINVSSQTGANIVVTNGLDVFTLGNPAGVPPGVTVIGPDAAQHQPGVTQTYEVYKVSGLSGDVKIVSDFDLYTAVFGYNNNAGVGGFFSGFSRIPEIEASSFPENCTPATLEATSGFDVYQWYLDGSPISGATNPTFMASSSGTYYVTAGVLGCDVDTSSELTLIGADYIDVGPDLSSCPNGISVSLSGTSTEAGASYTWSTLGNGSFSNANILNPDYTLGTDDIMYGSVSLVLSGLNDGCSDADTLLLTLSDNEPPTIMCPEDFTVSTDTGTCGWYYETFGGTFSDNCGEVTFEVLNPIPSKIYHQGTTTITFQVTDVAGNTATCSHDLTVEDNEDPTAICQSVTLSLDSNGEAVLTAAQIDGGSTDNCGVTSVEISQGDQDWDCSEVGMHTVTLTVTDANGNSSTCDASITVEDTSDPTAICQSVTLSLDSNGEAVLTAAQIDGGSTDNCGVASVEISQGDQDWDCSEVGMHMVTLTVTDANGNSSTCDASITVEDTSDPAAICQSVMLSLDSNGEAVLTAAQIDGGSTDNCGVASVEISQGDQDWDCSEVGMHTVTLTVTDANGNSSICDASITVEDTSDPAAICQSVTLSLDSNGEAVLTAAQIDGGSTDNCGVTSVEISQGDQDWDCSEVGMHTVTLTVTDANGNSSTCDASITVEDTSDPAAICQSVTLSLDTNGEAVLTAAQIDGGSTDNCGVASVEISQGDQDWDCSEVGMHTVTLTVTDANGNVSTCVSTVTVEDNVDPTAICQDITIELDADGNANIVSGDIDNGSSDNCGVASIEISQDDEDWDCSEVGTNTVTLTVTDVNGNVSTCDGELTVEDNVAPIAICQDITIGLDANGEAFITAADIDNGSNDACGTPSLSIAGEDEDWDCTEVGTHTVTLTVTDVNGNISTCAGELTVEDTIAPILVCNDVLVDLDPGLCGDIVQYAIETEDNCGVATEVLVSGPASGTYLDYHDSPWSVTWDVTDVNGNLSTCTFSITVNEYGNPTETLVCNDLVLVSLDEDGCSEIGADMVLEGGPYGCYDDYQVSVENGSAEVCCEDIGESLTVTVTDPDTGNSCTGTLEVYDNLSPYCVSIADYTIACEEEVPSADDIAHEGYPVFGDNCGIFQIYLASETTIESDICSDAGMQIERIWFALDLSGNVVSPEDVCVQTITIERTALTFLSDAEYDCADYETADLHPDLTGYPHPSQSSACMYAATYTDQLLPACGGLEKIVRTWTVLDWCSGMILTQDGSGNDNVQILKITDSTGPEIGEETYVLNAENADFCSTQGFLSLPEITDNCTSVEEINMFIAGLTELDYVTDGTGSIIGGYIPFPGLPLGDYEVLVTATDACGNYSERLLELSVEDLTAPTPVCDEITQVSLGSSGTAEVFALTFDDGSNDNCCLDGFDVRRMDGGDYGSSVVFACEDIGSSVAVELRVHDCHGNSNSCMVEVLVEDKIPPYLVTPADTDISCDDYYSDVAPHLDNGDGSILETLFGSSSSGDNCEVIETYSYTYSVDQCGEGSIVRSWTVNDPSGNGPVSGTQTISIYHVSDWSISFPGDLDASCVDGTLPDFGYPTVSDDECEMIAISYVDTQFDVVPDACYKIIREWSAINWCTYPEEAAVTAIQVIKVTDNEAPIFNVDDFTVEITEADCDTPVTLPTPEVTDCSDAVTIETSSDLPAGEAGPGTYTANYTVSDGCGNYSYDVITITVVDAKKPTPYVTDHLVTEIMQTGMTGIINVNDYDIGSFDNCSDVVLSFSSDVTDTDRQFTCEDLGENTLEIWVTDEAGNQDFVTVTMEVQDNMNACGPGTLTIAGALTTQDGEGIDGAMVDVNSGAFTEMTAGDGLFSFTLPSGGDYSIVPSLDTDADNGVTTYDMVLITQHILGVNTFTTPYNYIAADANNSQTVTTLDLVAIRKVILQIADSFPNNTSWRFVDADHVFTDATDPWDYPEVINYNNLDTDQLETDFIGIKIGDVNGSVQSNMNAAAEARTGDRVSVSTLDASLSAGEETIVALSLNEMLSGIQFTLVHEGLTFKGVEGGLCGADQLGQHDGQLTLSWNDSELRRLDGVDLIQLRFEANRAIDLSEGLYISSAKTRSEAYTANGIAELDLIFEGQSASMTILYDNVPNPFKEETVISFSLVEAGKVSITINDLNGKVIRAISGDYEAGYNNVRVNNIESTGVLFYTLASGDFTATKKMIIID